MAIVNSIAAFLSGIMQPTYFGQSIGNALSGSSNLTIPVQATTAVETVSGSPVNYLNRGFLRLKVYNLGGTSPTFQFNVFANSGAGELLYSSPTVSEPQISQPFFRRMNRSTISILNIREGEQAPPEPLILRTPARINRRFKV